MNHDTDGASSQSKGMISLPAASLFEPFDLESVCLPEQ